MDREQEEMQFLGFLGIYTESYKLIFSWRKIFSKITLSLILPLSFIYLVHMEISSLLFRNIYHTEIELDQTQSGTTKYQKLSDHISTELAYYWLFKVAYITLIFVFGLLSTSAVVYTVASAYTARDLTFGKVMSVVPRVWKRLMVTFLCMFVAMFAYNVLALFLFVVWVIFLIAFQTSNWGNFVLVVLIVFYVLGISYLTIIWQLASVVSVLEESYGFKAMVKSKNLIKGKLWVAIVVFLKLNISSGIILFLFQKLVVHGNSLSMANRVVYAMLCCLLLSKLILFGLVIQTVIYFVCKSYHHENIEKSALSEHLEVYLLAEYVPLKAKDVQLEQYHV